MNSPIVTTLDGIVGEGTAVVSVAPVSVAPVHLSAPERPFLLEVRISAPSDRHGSADRAVLARQWLVA